MAEPPNLLRPRPRPMPISKTPSTSETTPTPTPAPKPTPTTIPRIANIPSIPRYTPTTKLNVPTSNPTLTKTPSPVTKLPSYSFSHRTNVPTSNTMSTPVTPSPTTGIKPPEQRVLSVLQEENKEKEEEAKPLSLVVSSPIEEAIESNAPMPTKSAINDSKPSLTNIRAFGGVVERFPSASMDIIRVGGVPYFEHEGKIYMVLGRESPLEKYQRQKRGCTTYNIIGGGKEGKETLYETFKIEFSEEMKHTSPSVDVFLKSIGVVLIANFDSLSLATKEALNSFFSKEGVQKGSLRNFRSSLTVFYELSIEDFPEGFREGIPEGPMDIVNFLNRELEEFYNENTINGYPKEGIKEEYVEINGVKAWELGELISLSEKDLRGENIGKEGFTKITSAVFGNMGEWISGILRKQLHPTEEKGVSRKVLIPVPEIVTVNKSVVNKPVTPTVLGEAINSNPELQGVVSGITKENVYKILTKPSQERTKKLTEMSRMIIKGMWGILHEIFGEEMAKKLLEDNVKGIWIKALIHETFNPNINLNYEKLELLGDSIVNVVFYDYLRTKYPTMKHGDMSTARNKFTTAHIMAIASRALGLDKLLIHSFPNDVYITDAIIGDIFESFVGALYVVGEIKLGSGTGYVLCSKFVKYVYDALQEQYKYDYSNPAPPFSTSLNTIMSRLDIKYVSSDETRGGNITVKVKLCRSKPNDARRYQDYINNGGIDIMEDILGVGTSTSLTEASERAFSMALDTLGKYGINEEWAAEFALKRSFREEYYQKYNYLVSDLMKYDMKLQFGRESHANSTKSPFVQLYGITEDGKMIVLGESEGKNIHEARRLALDNAIMRWKEILETIEREEETKGRGEEEKVSEKRQEKAKGPIEENIPLHGDREVPVNTMFTSINMRK